MKLSIEQMSLEDKIGQLFVASLDADTLDESAARFISENHIGNIVHFGNNARNPAQTASLNDAIAAHIAACTGIPALIGIDHEGGRVMRFREGVTAFPSAMAVGAAGDVALAKAQGRAMGEELRALGFHMNFAPVLDVNSNPDNPVIGIRSFGDDPLAVARYGIAVACGIQAAGVMAVAKHFPGHGDTAVDSHFGLPRIDKPLNALERVELFPFAEAIRGGVEGIMTTHILFPQIEPDGVPATMSWAVLTGLLRQRMGFDGLILSDGMHMQAITERYGIERGCVEAIKAGVDLLCVGTGGPGFYESQSGCYRAVLAAARSGALPIERVDDAVRRVLAAKERLCAPKPNCADWAANARLADRVADASATWVAGGFQPLCGRVLCVSAPAVFARYGIEEGDWRTRPFAETLAEGLGADSLVLSAEGERTAIAQADTVIIGVSSGTEHELDCLHEAMRLGKRVIAVLTGLPYVVNRLPDGCPALCIYGLVPASVRAACRALRGDTLAAGKAPVAL